MQVSEEQKRASEIGHADIKKLEAELRTLKSHLEAAQSSGRKHASANERLWQEADAARVERDEARSTVTRLMDESTDVRSNKLDIAIVCNKCQACMVCMHI